MRQIRARIREKRGVDYTEEQIRELANVRLEKFLDPKRRSLDLARAVRAAGAIPSPSRAGELRVRGPDAVRDASRRLRFIRGC